MKKLFLLLSLSACLACVNSAPVIVYNGDTLQLNKEFRRRQTGSVKTSAVLPEISGIACSRVTPGYLWMESDDYSTIVATDDSGQKAYMKLRLSGIPSRSDWEDMCGGVYNGKNYLFVGAFGDNNEVNTNYYIFYFEEPEIVETSTTTTLPASYIKFEYPDGKSHNAEALMYDNVEQMLYVVTKVYYNVCSVYCLPMSMEYGTETQTLTYVCDLGKQGEQRFHLVTAADISPDGSQIIIKNHNNIIETQSVALLWKREGDESVRETLLRQPGQIAAYQYEWQGEAVAWLDSDNFYTTSDEDEGNPPIFKYTRVDDTSLNANEDISKNDKPILVIRGNQLFITKQNSLYSLDGRQVK